MTPRRGEAGRGPGASRAEAPAPPRAALPVLLLGALLLRVVIAYVLFPGAGFETDVNAYQSWAVTLARYGPDGFYQHAGFVDYAPGYLYILWLVGSVAQALGALAGASPFTFTPLLVKLPAIVFDLALGALIYAALRRWSGQRVAIVGAAMYLFNPVTWYESALWGQVDAVGTFVLLAAVLLLVGGWSEGAAGAAVAAALIKPQYAIILFVVGCVLLGRHLVAPGSGPVVHPRHPLLVRLNDALGGWFTTEQGPWRLVSSAAVGLIVLFFVITPFDLAQYAAQKAPALAIGGDLGGLAVVYGQAAGQYHYLTLNAYNPWALIGPQSLAATWLWNAQSDLEPAIGPIPWFAIGAFLLAVAFVYLGYRLIRRTDRTSIIVTATVLAVAFFILPTRSHERYLFPAFALGALLAARSREWRWWYILLAGANVVNQHAVLTYPLFATPNVENLAFGELFRSEPVVIFISLAHTALFGWALWRVRPGLPQAQPAITVAPASPDHDGEGGTGGAGPGPVPRSTSASAQPLEGSQPLPEAPWREVELVPPGWWRALRARLTMPSIRPDRSALLHGERGGRFDGLDALAVILVLVVGLSLRAFRADQPSAMVTLDEVYHARTATEFLQDWRYGMPHSIYEYTHPHLAKYLMAVGIVVLGNDRVVATSELGTQVRSMALERAYAAADRPGRRAGDRLFIATGAEVRVMDLRNGADEGRVPVAATAVALDEGNHTLYVGAQDGTVWSLATALLDRWRDVGGGVEDFEPLTVADVGAPVERLWAAGPDRLVVASGAELLAVDTSTGRLLARRSGLSLGGAIPLEAVATVVVHPDAVPGIADEARTLADLLGLDAGQLEASCGTPSPDPIAGVRVASRISTDQRSAVQEAIDDGRLSGTEIVDRVPLVAALPSGLAVLDTTSLETFDEVPLEAAALGLDRVGRGSDQRLYVARADETMQIVRIETSGTLSRGEQFPMPGPLQDVRWNPATNLVHVLGRSPAGTPTVYVVETHGNAVFADAALPFEAAAWTLDVQPDRPSVDRQRALVFAADGRSASVDVGRNAFAWRFPGVLLGVLMAAAVYLLGRILFRRRAVALLATAAVVTDGMLFAHSRDAMNDAYVGFFIVAALTVLAWLWAGDGRRSARAVAIGLPVVGVLLGLGLASKWVAIFAVGAALLLVLLRSAIGRLVALAGMAMLAGLLGNLALATGNVAFALLMLGLTLLMAAGLAWRPQEFSREEVRFAAVAPTLLGVALLGAAVAGMGPAGAVRVAGVALPTVAAAGLVCIAAGAAWWLVSRVAIARRWIRVSGLRGGPLALGDDAPAPLPEGWLRPGAAGGLAMGYVLASLVVLPLVVYVATYIPWARPWDDACPLPTNTCPQIIPATIAPDGSTIAEGWPAGHRGQTLLDLTRGMYDYHNNLRATHPATSPWWAWPFDLKPVWLFQDPYGAGTTAVVFDAGNMVTFWLAVPAIGFGLWQAWRRRSLALAFVGISFLALWLGWARVDRASFQYHYYTALPFAFLLLGYFLAELWHGPSARTWMLARVAGAAAILAPGTMWLLKDPLCSVAGVTTVNPSSYLCTSQSGTLAIPTALVAISVILVVGMALIVRELLVIGRAAGSRASSRGGVAGGTVDLAALVRLGTVVISLGIAVTAVPRLVGSGSFTFTGSLGQVWVIGALLVAVGLLFAWLVLGARDSRGAVVVVVGSAVLWFVVFYPYIADLPLPANAPYLYQRILPTFDYSFQFAVNQAPSPAVGILDPQGLVLAASIGLAAVVTLLLVRQVRLDRLALAADDGAPGEVVGAQRP